MKILHWCHGVKSDGDQSQGHVLQVECSGDDPVRHGEGGEQTHHEAQSSAGLGQWKDIGHSVTAAGGHKHPEMQQRRAELWPSESIEKANHQEGDDIL